MKVNCPHCEKKFKAPDEWAGKRVRCPSCKEALTIPVDANGEGGLSLDSLSSLEDGGQAVEFERPKKALTLKEAQAATAAVVADQEQSQGKQRTKVDPSIRVCPKCKRKVRAADIYTDVICNHCGSGISGAQIDKGEEAKYTDGMKDRMLTKVSFYSGFSGAAIYPIGGITHILTAVGIGLGVIVAPLAGILAFLGASGLNDAAEKVDFGWVGPVLGLAFGAEGIYFGAVAYYLLIDTVRATTAGNESPPGLTWNVVNLGAALGGYVILIVFYIVMITLLLMFGGGQFPPSSAKDFEVLTSPASIITLAILTFSVPMNVLGLSSSAAMDGLHPVKVAKSIWQTIGHYTFLYLISILALGFYSGIMIALMSWAGPKIAQAITKGIGEGIGQLGLGLAAWAIVIGFAFYFSYMIGRILGLYARTYREQLEFEL